MKTAFGFLFFTIVWLGVSPTAWGQANLLGGAAGLDPAALAGSAGLPGAIPGGGLGAASSAFGGATSALAAAPTGPPTLFSFLGVNEVFRFAGGVVKKIFAMPIVQVAHQTVLKPTLQVMGLKPTPGASLLPPGLGGQPFGAPSTPAGPLASAGGPAASPGAPPSSGSGSPPGGASSGGSANGGAAPGGTAEGEPEAPPPDATALAASLSAKESDEEVKLKVRAIRYLAKQNCVCYPEVIDALLGVLDDCSEIVRYEAVKALRQGCGGQRFCRPCNKFHAVANEQKCACQPRVISRLSDVLLKRDAQGRLKERSARVRELAKLILLDCLRNTPIQRTDQPQARPDPFIMQPTP